MPKLIWTTTALLLLQTVQSYILLTANIEDVQNVAKRLAQLPISGQVGNIVRRAYDVFDNAYSRLSNSKGFKRYMRTGDWDDRDETDTNRGPDYSDMSFRRNSGIRQNAQNTSEHQETQREPIEAGDEGREEQGERNEDLQKLATGQDEHNKGHEENNDPPVESGEGRVEPAVARSQLSEDQGEARGRDNRNGDRDETSKVPGNPNERRSDSEKAHDEQNLRRTDQEEFSTLGKSASVYLKQIKKIFENA